LTQVIAIDWSGRKKGAAEAIWLARVVDGKIIDLENGRDRQAVIDKAIELAGRDLDTVVAPGVDVRARGMGGDARARRRPHRGV
jgi:hypothetical protein